MSDNDNDNDNDGHHDDSEQGDNGEQGEFGETEELVLEALSHGLTHSEAAAWVHREAKFVQRLMRRDDFRLEVNRRRAAHFTALAGQIRALGPRAIEVHREVMENPDASDQLRLRAAMSALTFAMRLNAAADLELRVFELESKVLDGSPTINEVGR